MSRNAVSHVLVMGPIGCGKSTVGAVAAARLGRPLLDNDVVLHEMFGMTAREMADRLGLPRLHAAELQVLRRMLSGTEPSVITAAASTLDSAPVELVEPHVVVLLRCDPRTAARRAVERAVVDARRAPAVRMDRSAWERRLARIDAIADLVVDAAATTVTDAADAITSYVAERLPRRPIG